MHCTVLFFQEHYSNTIPLLLYISIISTLLLQICHANATDIVKTLSRPLHHKFPLHLLILLETATKHKISIISRPILILYKLTISGPFFQSILLPWLLLQSFHYCFCNM